MAGLTSPGQADPVSAPPAPDKLTSSKLSTRALSLPQVSDIQPNRGAATSKPGAGDM